MSQEPTPVKIDLKKDERLVIEWGDGEVSTYSISLLRTMCPCATCKLMRTGMDPHSIMPQKPKSISLKMLPGNYSGAIAVTSAELVGNYAMKIAFSDEHDAGIYSFRYLRELGGGQKPGSWGSV